MERTDVRMNRCARCGQAFIAQRIRTPGYCSTSCRVQVYQRRRLGRLVCENERLRTEIAALRKAGK